MKSDSENKTSKMTLRRRNSNARDYSNDSDYSQDNNNRFKHKNSINRDKVGFHIIQWDHSQEEEYLDGINTALQGVDINADDQIEQSWSNQMEDKDLDKYLKQKQNPHSLSNLDFIFQTSSSKKKEKIK